MNFLQCIILAIISFLAGWLAYFFYNIFTIERTRWHSSCVDYQTKIILAADNSFPLLTANDTIFIGSKEIKANQDTICVIRVIK